MSTGLLLAETEGIVQQQSWRCDIYLIVARSLSKLKLAPAKLLDGPFAQPFTQ